MIEGFFTTLSNDLKTLKAAFIDDSLPKDDLTKFKIHLAAARVFGAFTIAVGIAFAVIPIAVGSASLLALATAVALIILGHDQFVFYKNVEDATTSVTGFLWAKGNQWINREGLERGTFIKPLWKRASDKFINLVN